jgi:WD40 repeat protein
MLREKISGGGTPTTQVAWSPGGGLVIGASTEGALRLWDVKTGSLLRSFGGIPLEVNDIAWSPDGKFIATASFDNEVSLWIPGSGMLMTRLAGHRKGVKSVAWSPEVNTLASASADGAVNLWDFRTGRTLNTLETIFASGSDEGAIRIWRIDEPADNFQIALEGHTKPVTKIYFSPKGSLLASRSNDDTVRVWRAPDWRCVAIINVSTSFAGTNAYFPVLAFHPIEPLLATCVDRPDEISILELDEDALINSSSDIHDEPPPYLD